MINIFKKMWLVIVTFVFCGIIIGVVFPQSTSVVYAARQKASYISDLKLVSTNDEAEAKSKLENAGYKFLSSNLNDGNQGYQVYMGYKTTSDPNDAITDIALMNMKGGYDISTYENILTTQQENINAMLDIVKTVINGYRTNYNSGALSAIYAKNKMNSFKEDDTKELLGDLFLNDEKCTNLVLANLIMQSNGLVIATMYKYLALGSTPYNTDSFLKRLSDLGPVDLSAEQDALNADASALMELAEKFRDTLNECIEFGKEVTEAVKNEDDKETAAFNYIQKAREGDRLAAKNAPMLETLKGYTYGSGTLFDLFTKESFTVTDFYPLAKVATKCEISGMCLAGLQQYVELSGNTEENWQTLISDYNEFILENEDFTVVSVYEGQDRDLYNENVAVTSAASLNSVEGEAWYEKFFGNKNSEVADTIIYSLMGIAAVTSIVSYITTPIIYGYYAQFNKRTNFAKVFYARSYDDYLTHTMIKGSREAMYKIENETGSCGIFWVDYHGFSTGGIVFTVSTSVLAVLVAIDICWELLEYYDKDYTPMPDMIFDFISTDATKTFVRYDAVTSLDKKSDGAGYVVTDLNGGEANQWICMYTTKNQSVGAPITTNMIVTDTTDDINSTYEPVHWFGSKNSAADMMAYSGEFNYIYMYFARNYNAITVSNTASTFTLGILALTGGLAMLVGVSIGIGSMVIYGKRKKETIKSFNNK